MWFEDVYYRPMQTEFMYENICDDFEEINYEEYALSPTRSTLSLFPPKFYVTLSLVPERGNVRCRLCIGVF